MLSKFQSLASMRNVAGAALLIAASLPAQSATMNDNYWGGLNLYNPGTGDVIGSNSFNITSVDVTRSGSGNGQLNVTIHTYYAGLPGAPAAEQTGYGSLFFSTTPFIPSGSAPYGTDQFVADRFNYAFTMPATPGSNTGSGALYAIGANLSSHTYSGAVKDYYTTQNGTIYMSNVHGNPITATHAGNPGFYFREGQAVQFQPNTPYDPNNPNDPNKPGTWTITPTTSSLEGAITFAILDDGLLGNSFTLAWAMTCANDVFLETFTLRGGSDFPTPLPAAVWLFGTVIAGGAGIGRWRKAKKARALAG